MNSRECHLKEDVRLYHWNSHISLYEVQLKPAQEDLPDWSRVTELQVVFSLEIDRTTADGSVAVRSFGFEDLGFFRLTEYVPYVLEALRQGPLAEASAK